MIQDSDKNSTKLGELDLKNFPPKDYLEYNLASCNFNPFPFLLFICVLITLDRDMN